MNVFVLKLLKNSFFSSWGAKGEGKYTWSFYRMLIYMFSQDQQ